MADDDIEIPERAADDGPPRRDARRDRPKRRRWGLLALLLLVGLPLALFALVAFITLSFSYSKGERAGYQQKISQKGWLCKTWEGELLVSAIPGVSRDSFPYTVRDEAIAQQLERLQGRRVSVTYEQHRFVPTNCFGETEYFVTSVRAIDEPGVPGQYPVNPGMTGVPVPAPAQPGPAQPAPAPPAPAPPARP